MPFFQEEFTRLKSALDALRDRSVCRGDRILAARIGAMLECAGPGHGRAFKETEEDAVKAKENSKENAIGLGMASTTALGMASTTALAAAPPATLAAATASEERRPPPASSSRTSLRTTPGLTTVNASEDHAGTTPRLSPGSTPCPVPGGPGRPEALADRVDVATSPDRLDLSDEEYVEEEEDDADRVACAGDTSDATTNEEDDHRPAPPLTLKELRAVQRSFKRSLTSSSGTIGASVGSGVNRRVGGGSSPSVASPSVTSQGPCNGEHPRRHHHHHHHHRKHHHRHKQAAQVRSRSYEDSAAPGLVSPRSAMCGPDGGSTSRGGLGGGSGSGGGGGLSGLSLANSEGRTLSVCAVCSQGKSTSCPSSSQDSSPNGVFSAPLILDLDDKNRFTEEVTV